MAEKFHSCSQENIPESEDARRATSEPNPAGEQISDRRHLNAINKGDIDNIISLLEKSNSQCVFTQDILNELLLAATVQGQKFLVCALIRAGASVHTRDPDGSTPLMICLEKGFKKIAQFLVSKGADVNAKNQIGHTPLILAVRSSGGSDLIDILLVTEKVDLEYENQGVMALMKALELRDIGSMELLLKQLKSHFYFKSYAAPNVGAKSEISMIDVAEFEKTLETVTYNCETTRQISLRIGLDTIFENFKRNAGRKLDTLLQAARSRDLKVLDILLDMPNENKNSDDATYRALEIFMQDFKPGDLMSAVDLAVIKKLVKGGANFDHNPKCRRQPLLIAVDVGCYEAVQLLCEHGASPSVCDNENRSALAIAAATGRCDLVELLLKYKSGKDIVNTPDYLVSPLHEALTNGHIECAKLLLQRGARMDFDKAIDIAVAQDTMSYFDFLVEHFEEEYSKFRNLKSQVRKTLTSAVKAGNLEVIDLLLKQGIEVNSLSENNTTLLMESLNMDVLRLKKEGAHVNKKGKTSSTTRREAVESRDVPREFGNKSSSQQDVVEALLKQGAETEVKDGHGRTPLMVAAAKKLVDSVTLLLNHGADVNAADKIGKTAVFHAVESKSLETVKCLLEHNFKAADLNQQRRTASTALRCAVKSGKAEMISVLLGHGADINWKDGDGNTAVGWALHRDPKKGILTQVIKAHANINYENNGGLTPLMIAAATHNVFAVTELLKNNAEVNAESHILPPKTTALALLLKKNISDEGVLCALHLLHKGSALPEMSPTILHYLILSNATRLVRALIAAGAGPVSKRHFATDFYYDRLLGPQFVEIRTPLHAALFINNVALANCFVENWFLTWSDVSKLRKEVDLRRYLVLRQHQDSLDILDRLSSQPFSLVTLAFVVVSDAVGTGLNRAERISQLNAPPVVKKYLLFKEIKPPAGSPPKIDV